MHTILVLYLALGFHVVATATNYVNETDCQALLAFKARVTVDPFGILSSWNESYHFCKWHGVECSSGSGRVIELNLGSQSLKGTISPFIGNLSFLRILDLQNNSFIDRIPPELGRLKKLQILWLNNNSFGGEIPVNISGCINLIGLNVSFNKLLGEIPEALGSLSKLKYIHVRKNNLFGSIPPSLGNLSSLVHFNAYSNRLSGSIPDTLGKLLRLEYFSLLYNEISGVVPDNIFNLSSLKVLSLSYNYIQGNLPSWLGFNLPNLTVFGIGENQLSGSIPLSLSNLSNLEILDVSDNNLAGKVPSLQQLHNLRNLGLSINYLGNGEDNDLSFICSLINSTNLKVLGLNDNNFGGVLPDCTGNLSIQLALFHLEYNQISGSIPSGITNLINLEDFHIGYNQFTGGISPDFGKLLKLQLLDMSNNKFSGNIPSSLGNLSLLTVLGLGHNYLEQIIPPSLGNTKYLLFSDLAENNLSGVIPRELFDLSSLVSLDLSHNQLTGSLPIEIGNLQNIIELNVSENVLSGKMPDTLSDCVSLEELNMQGNFFNGTIPSSLRSMRGIRILDLSRNKLSGKIPEYFSSFDLLCLNFSFNDLEGEVPEGRIFKNASIFIVKGNPRLCGGVPELQLPKCNSRWRKRMSSTLKLGLKICFVFGMIGFCSLLAFLFLFLTKKRKSEPLSYFVGNSPIIVSYQSLLRATDGFSSANLIGMGSFGSVYKGILDHEGMTVAVKVFNLWHHGASRSFFDECMALRNLRHRNLVKVLTACSSLDYQGNEFKALVYQFMCGGNLEEWLHPDPQDGLVVEGSKNLKPLQRLSIATDVACALDYLHNHSQTPVVHCDLKPSNILLDSELVAHVSDFGLARILQAEDQLYSTSTTIGIRGSIGYTAPEYGMGSEVSPYGDVYSFGIVLLELFTGKRPTDEMFLDGLNLHNFVNEALPDRVLEIIDPTLIQEWDEEEESNTRDFKNELQDCLISVLRIGIACSQELPRERMRIALVVAELNSIKQSLSLSVTTVGQGQN